MSINKPELSIIIPVLNEERCLPLLLDDLAAQEGVSFEIIVADGGSIDSTKERCSEFAVSGDIPLLFLETPGGRGIQQNRGAEAAEAATLLFLHADTRIHDPDLLRKSLVQLNEEAQKTPSVPVAGHFGLRFLRNDSSHEGAYYFYESKSRINRAECINGDQGLMVSRYFFNSLGGFDESLPYMEDARIARKIFAQGRWITLPGIIATSARRFETEGFKERQTLNALMRNFDATGFHTFFTAAEHAYRSQEKAARLNLEPFLRVIHQEIKALGTTSAVKFWYQTGRYVASNAWQLAFALDCRKNRHKRLPPGTGPTPRLALHDKITAPFLTSAPGAFMTAIVTAAWFYSLLFKSTPRRS